MNILHEETGLFKSAVSEVEAGPVVLCCYLSRGIVRRGGESARPW